MMAIYKMCAVASFLWVNLLPSCFKAPLGKSKTVFHVGKTFCTSYALQNLFTYYNWMNDPLTL